jgi:hypothetical protein
MATGEALRDIAANAITSGRQGEDPQVAYGWYVVVGGGVATTDLGDDLPP